jgi:phosphatidylglycerol:prolipoprotein diacylglycerol transferase
MHPAFLHLGHLRIPLYGLCAAVGLMAALTLCQVPARLVRLNPAKVWDAALTMAIAALVISRALLVAGSWHSFLTAPLLILALPSLNDTGILLTAVFTFFYLRRKHLPLLPFLDAMAPCFALVWAFLSLGEIVAGTRDGMPTRFFIAVSNDMATRVQPVEFYTLIAALLLAGILIRALTRQPPAGHTIALASILSGATIFALDFLRLPSALFVAAILDPVQWLALAMIVVGCALYIALPAITAAPAERTTVQSEKVTDVA